MSTVVSLERGPTPWTLLNYLDHGNNALVMRVLQQAPVTNKIDIADRCDSLAASTARKKVRDHQKRGLVREHPHQNQYETTSYGDHLIDIYDKLTDTVGTDGVSTIAKSPCIIPILQSLDEEPKTLDGLVAAEEISVGRSAISRRRDELESLGWIDRAPPYVSEPDGRVAIAGYSVYASSATSAIKQRRSDR